MSVFVTFPASSSSTYTASDSRSGRWQKVVRHLHIQRRSTLSLLWARCHIAYAYVSIGATESEPFQLVTLPGVRALRP
jgi:hypothetical protein